LPANVLVPNLRTVEYLTDARESLRQFVERR
jgi:hypothetical protein